MRILFDTMMARQLPSNDPFAAKTKVRKPDGTTGYLTGGWFQCDDSGCGSTRLVVRWSSGTVSHVCSTDMEYDQAKGMWNVLKDQA